MTGRLAGVVHHLAKQITATYRHSLKLVFGEVYVTPAYRKTKRVIRFFYGGASGTILTFCVGYTFANVFGFPACVDGASMTPTLNHPAAPSYTKELYARVVPKSYTTLRYWLALDVDWVFVNCWAARGLDVERGEVVIFTSPKDPPGYVIKRVIALEGDEVETSAASSVVLKRGAAWVEGDNTLNSIDSNTYGPICLGLVVGKATHVVWPPERWRRLKPDLAPAIKRRGIEQKEDGKLRFVLHESSEPVADDSGDWM